jgi:phosphoribosyl 1,2-cyclic phosphodiesterase
VSDFTIKFWGTRGSIACPGKPYLRFGGETACLEVVCGERRLVFDAGSGIRRLGERLAGTPEALDLDLFITHTHFDHICGISFFAPLYNPENTIRLWAGHFQDRNCGLRDVLDAFMCTPFFPVTPDAFVARHDYVRFEAGERLEPHPGIVIDTLPLNHFGGCTGYRINYGERSISLVTDTEHPAEGHDERIVDFIRDTDLFIYDTMYEDCDFPAKRGWGHSTWQEGVWLADAADAKQLLLFHHDPTSTDEHMDRIVADAAAARPGTIAARDGLVIEL